jgi:hypothetical protein
VPTAHPDLPGPSQALASQAGQSGQMGGGGGFDQQARRLLWNVCICPAGTRMPETRKRALGLQSRPLWRRGATLRQRGWGGRLQSADATRRQRCLFGSGISESTPSPAAVEGPTSQSRPSPQDPDLSHPSQLRAAGVGRVPLAGPACDICAWRAHCARRPGRLRYQPSGHRAGPRRPVPLLLPPRVPREAGVRFSLGQPERPSGRVGRS